MVCGDGGNLLRNQTCGLAFMYWKPLQKQKRQDTGQVSTEQKITELFLYEIQNSQNTDARLRALKILKLLNVKIDYAAFLHKIDLRKDLSLYQKLNLTELKQLCGLEYSMDSLSSFRQETMFGSVYFSDNKINPYGICNSVIQNTLTAYRIYRNDSTKNHSPILEKMRNYFFEQKSGGSWINTFESSRIIETILPDLISGEGPAKKPLLHLTGAVNKTVDEFPFETRLNAPGRLILKKTGDFPLYVSYFNRYWNPAPEVKEKDFVVHTFFENEDSSLLREGEKTKLIVKVQVLKDADYVMINIPIPAGCSYAEKNQHRGFEVHREYFRNETSIFCEKLKEGGLCL